MVTETCNEQFENLGSKENQVPFVVQFDSIENPMNQIQTVFAAERSGKSVASYDAAVRLKSVSLNGWFEDCEGTFLLQ